MCPDGTNPATRKAVGDERLSRFAGITARPVSRGNSVGYLYYFVCHRRTSKATQTDNDVVREMDDGKTVSPRISGGRTIQLRQKIRRNLRSREKVTHAISHFDVEAALVNVRTLEERAQVLRCVRQESNVAGLHDNHGSNSLTSIRVAAAGEWGILG